MGVNITAYAETKTPGGSWQAIKDFQPFDCRDTYLFAFFAGYPVKGFRASPRPISSPRGLPENVSAFVKAEFEEDREIALSPSWLSVKELNDFDYGTPIVERRISPHSPEDSNDYDSEDEKKAYRELLPENYFKDLKKLNEVKAKRIVFWLDN